MVKCPIRTPSQVKANLAYTKRPSVFSFDSNFFSWVYDPVKGQMVCVTEKDNEGTVPESEESELDSNKADKRCPPTARDDLVYFFVSCFLDILLESWEGKPCLKPKLAACQSLIPNESEEFGEDLGPCEASIVSSTADYLKDLYQKRTSNLSKEKLLVVGSSAQGKRIRTIHTRKKDSESTEYEYLNEDDLESGGMSEQWRMFVADEDVSLVFGNGVWYKGRVSRRMMEGEGTYFWEDGAAYQGEFEGGCMTGKGRLEFPDLSVYEGGVYKAFRHGEGMFCLADSQVMYSGQWWLGKKHGHGLIVYSDPSEGHNYYRGQWQDGVKEGFGFRQYPSGARYIGFWSKGQRNGKGVMFWSNNDIYRGQWKDGLMHGYGEYTWNGFINSSLSYAADNTYRGYWSEGKRNGVGVFELKNGSLIETCWMDNAKDGIGAVVCTNGSVIVAAPLFCRDRQSLFKKQDDNTGLLVKEQIRNHRKNDEQLFTYLRNIGRNKAIPIPIHSPVHTLSLCSHTQKLFDQRKRIILDEMDASLSKTQVLTLTPEVWDRASEECFAHSAASKDLSEGHFCQLSECMIQEEKYLRNYIIFKMSALRACYDHYATLACEKPTSFKCVLLRMFLWQMFADVGVGSWKLSLVDVDLLLAREESLLLESPHHPFERFQFWQFLQILIILSWHFYGQYVYGTAPLIDDKRLRDFLVYYSNCECKSVLKTAFEYFTEYDLFLGRFRQDLHPPPSRRNGFEESDLAPMEAMYAIYCDVGEPHSARDFVNAICGERTELEGPSAVRYFEKLPSYQVEGKNAFTVAGELHHLPGAEPFNLPEIFGLEGRPTRSSPKAELTYFRSLKARRVVSCLSEVCPGIFSDGFIANMDYQLTFIEFYKAIVKCAELQLKIKTMNEIRGDVIAEYKSQLEEYRKQLNDYDKLKETSVVSRKKSRQFSDVSKKGRK